VFRFKLVTLDKEDLKPSLHWAEPKVLLDDAHDRAVVPTTVEYQIDPAPAQFVPDRTIVTFCTCPNEASAAVLARQLIDAGYRHVRVLTGGNDAIALPNAVASVG
jgi:hypothetical protein